MVASITTYVGLISKLKPWEILRIPLAEGCERTLRIVSTSMTWKVLVKTGTFFGNFHRHFSIVNLRYARFEKSWRGMKKTAAWRERKRPRRNSILTLVEDRKMRERKFKDNIEQVQYNVRISNNEVL